jgi:hypothetical protein
VVLRLIHGASRNTGILLHICIATARDAVVAPKRVYEAALLETALDFVRSDQVEDLGVQASAVPAAVRLANPYREDIVTA